MWALTRQLGYSVASLIEQEHPRVNVGTVISAVREKRRSSRLFALASGARTPAELKNEASAAGAAGSDGCSAALDCQKKNAPVSSRKDAAAPARKRHMGTSQYNRRFGAAFV